MDKILPTLLTLAVVALVFVALARGWRARTRAQAELGAPAAPPAELGAVAHREDLLYVATTKAEQPLERITVAGLGFRARAAMTVAEAGVVLDLTGADAVFVPRDRMLGAGRASWTIDKAVGADRLVVLTWSLNGTAVDTYLRPADPGALLGALTGLVAAPTTRRSES